MMKAVKFFLSMIIIWVDKYHFRCNLAIGNGIKKFITISVGYYNFGCHIARIFLYIKQKQRQYTKTHVQTQIHNTV